MRCRLEHKQASLVASARVEPLGQVNQKILLGFKKGSKLN
jgi:hypothetical protein